MAETQAVKPAETKNLPTAEINFEADAGKGMETADRDAYAIPFLLVLQPLSPAVVEATVKGAAPGMLMNSVTQELYGSELLVVPCAYQRRWIRWVPRDQGGGFKGEFSTAEVAEMRKRGTVKDLDGRLYYPLEDGSINEKKSDGLADTRSHFVLAVRSMEDPIGVPMVLALSSTGIKVSKLFNSRIDSVKFTRAADGAPYTPPSFANLYRVKAALQKNSKGSWWSYDIQLADRIKSPTLYEQARAFHDSVLAGAIEVAHESMTADAAATATAESDGF